MIAARLRALAARLARALGRGAGPAPPYSQLSTTAPPALVDRTARLLHLEAESAAVAPLLPVAAAHLEAVSREVADAVIGVTSAFHGMADRTRQIVDGTGRSGDSHGVVRRSIERSRETVAVLLGRLEEQTASSARAAERMQDIEHAIARIAGALMMVADVARTTRCLAVNARIEAIRVGEAGKGFGVVAEEITTLVRQTEQMRLTIEGILREVRETTDVTARELNTIVAQDQSALAEGRANVEVALMELSAAHETLESSLAAAEAGSTAVGQEIGRAVLQLQFQDRVSQRLGHVVDSLRYAEATLAPAVGALEVDAPAEVGRRREESLQRLRASYTMESEHHIHLAGTGHQPAAEPDPVDIELF